ncbi:MAG: hypothetical protein QOH06_2187 [Acidobacteriota bacterium]|jgi:hypothetical protein|nr:hypothetical protein [Acidobacteriota bacterium]
MQRKLRSNLKPVDPSLQAKGVDSLYDGFVEALTDTFIFDDEISILLDTLRGLRRIDEAYPKVEGNTFSELLIRLRDRKEGNLLKRLFEELNYIHYKLYPDVIVALMDYLSLPEGFRQAYSASLEIGIFNFDTLQEKLATTSALFEAYMKQKVLEIKSFAEQEDEPGLQTLFRDFYHIYALLVNLLFMEDLPKGINDLWQHFKGKDIVPSIKDPKKKEETHQNSKSEKKKSLITVMVTTLAEKAHESFDDLANFSAEHPIVINAANAVVDSLKTNEQKKLAEKLVFTKVLTKGGIENRAPDRLKWIDLVRIWLWEMGPESLTDLNFGENALTTKDVKDLLGTRTVIEEARNEILAGNYELYDREIKYDTPEFSNSVKNRNKAFNFLGGYRVRVKPVDKSSKGAYFVDVRIELTSQPNLVSFSRFRAPEKPDGTKRGIIENNRKRGDEGVKIGATLTVRWTWEERLPLFP